MSRSHFLRRRFLNKRGFHAGAYVLAECRVESTRRGVTPSTQWVTASLTVADCSRVATLDFDVSTEAEAANAIRKARILQVTVEDFVVALEESVNAWREQSR